MQKISIINGPNLNTLGLREPHIYGYKTLDDINKNLLAVFESQINLTFFQSNHEGQIIDFIQNLQADALVINPGGLSHTSICLRDALAALNIPIIEVHLSNIFARETYRHHSFVSEVSKGIICGLKDKGYEYAIRALIRILNKE